MNDQGDFPRHKRQKTYVPQDILASLIPRPTICQICMNTRTPSLLAIPCASIEGDSDVFENNSLFKSSPSLAPMSSDHGHS